MRFDPEEHHRRSIRLRGYDYSQPGAYFVTICTQDPACILADVVDGEMHATKFGAIAESCWLDLANHYAELTLDIFVIMPNHVHGIVVLRLRDDGRTERPGFKPAPTRVTKTHGLQEIVRGFKTFSSRRINQTRRTPGTHVCQRNYYERVMRKEDELNLVRQYILDNPANWADDDENPENAP